MPIYWREERAHEPCPHCGRQSCSWHGPGRFCAYAYRDQPGEVRPVQGVTRLDPAIVNRTCPRPAGKVA